LNDRNNLVLTPLVACANLYLLVDRGGRGKGEKEERGRGGGGVRGFSDERNIQ